MICISIKILEQVNKSPTWIIKAENHGLLNQFLDLSQFTEFLLMKEKPLIKVSLMKDPLHSQNFTQLIFLLYFCKGIYRLLPGWLYSGKIKSNSSRITEHWLWFDTNSRRFIMSPWCTNQIRDLWKLSTELKTWCKPILIFSLVRQKI